MSRQGKLKMGSRYLESYSDYLRATPGTVIEGFHWGVWEKGRDYKWYDAEAGSSSKCDEMCGYPRAVIVEGEE